MEQELIEHTGVIAEYNPFRAEIAELKSKNAALVFDYGTEEGEKEARSHIYKLKLSKGALDRVRKEVKDESVQRGRLIDAEAKAITAELDGMIAVHQAPLDEKLAREDARVAALKARVEELAPFIPGDECMAWYLDVLQRIEAIAVDHTFEEFMAIASVTKENTVAVLRDMAEKARVREFEAVELALLRADRAAQEQRERDERIAKEAAEKAVRDQQAAHDRELQAARDAAAKAERDAAAAAQRAKDAEAKAKRDADAAAAAAKAETEKRERNKRHRAGIHNGIIAVLCEKLSMDKDEAKDLVILIASGELPNVTITY